MPTYSGYNAPIVPAQFGTNLPQFNYPNLSTPTTTSTTIPSIAGNSAVTVAPNANPNALVAPQQNVASLPDIIALTNAIDAMNRQNQQAANAARIPGGAALEQQSSDLIKQELAGQVPSDVVNLLRQQGAEQNVVSGRDSNAAYLKALGLTSLGQEQQGETNLTAADARNPVAPLFDPTSQLITPYQQGILGIDQARLALEAQQLLRNPGSRGTPQDFSGTGGTAMGPAAPSNLGSTLFPDMSPSSTTTPTDTSGQDAAWWEYLMGFGPGTDFPPAGTVTTPDSSLAPGSPGTFWNVPPDLSPAGTVNTPDASLAPGSPGTFWNDVLGY